MADIASSGTANSFIRARHITKTSHAHQVKAASLFTLLQQAYNGDDAIKPDSPPLEEWCTRRAKDCVHFDYWIKSLSLELLLLRYIRRQKTQLAALKSNCGLFPRLYISCQTRDRHGQFLLP